MNRYLLAGSAVVALALGATAAQAQSKFEVRMGGDAVFEAAFVGQDRDVNRRSSEFFDRFRLNIVATGKSDNGLTYGGRLRIRTNQNSAVDNDRAYIFIGGAFGQFKLGTTNSYNDDAGAVYWPIAFQTGPLLLNNRGVSYASSGNGSAITATLTPYSLTDNGNASKIVYYSPRFSGFQLGASYTPNSSSSGQNVNRADNGGTLNDVWELGLNYQGEFSGVGLNFGAGYQGGSFADSGFVAGAQLEDYTAWQVGANVSYAGFTFGGGYINKGDSGQLRTTGNQDDFVTWGLGLQYATGPLTVGVSYTHGDGVVNPASGANLTGVAVAGGNYNGSVEQDQWAVGALYAVAPGLLVGAEYNYIDADAPGTANDDKANVFILRSALVF